MQERIPPTEHGKPYPRAVLITDPDALATIAAYEDLREQITAKTEELQLMQTRLALQHQMLFGQLHRLDPRVRRHADGFGYRVSADGGRWYVAWGENLQPLEEQPPLERRIQPGS